MVELGDSISTVVASASRRIGRASASRQPPPTNIRSRFPRSLPPSCRPSSRKSAAACSSVSCAESKRPSSRSVTPSRKVTQPRPPSSPSSRRRASHSWSRRLRSSRSGSSKLRTRSAHSIWRLSFRLAGDLQAFVGVLPRHLALAQVRRRERGGSERIRSEPRVEVSRPVERRDEPGFQLLQAGLGPQGKYAATARRASRSTSPEAMSRPRARRMLSSSSSSQTPASRGADGPPTAASSASERKWSAWRRCSSSRSPLLESLGRVLPDRLQHPEPLPLPAKQALVDQRLQGVYVCVADLLRRLKPAAAPEGGQASNKSRSSSSRRS